MKKIKKIAASACLSLSVALLAESSYLVMQNAFADESFSNKVKNDLDDASKDVKKGTRKAKKKVRDASGRGSVKKDVQDSVQDLKDDVSTEAGKIKRKGE